MSTKEELHKENGNTCTLICTHARGVRWLCDMEPGSHSWPFLESCASQMSQNKLYKASTLSPTVRCHKCKTASCISSDSLTSSACSSTRWHSHNKDWFLFKNWILETPFTKKTENNLIRTVWKLVSGFAVCQVRLWQGSGGSDGCGWWW